MLIDIAYRRDKKINKLSNESSENEEQNDEVVNED